MVGKLKIDMTYDPSIISRAEMWGNIRFTYHDEKQVIPLFHTREQLDLFVRWYLSASPYIFAEPPVPFVEGKSYAETVLRYLYDIDDRQMATADPTESKAIKENDEIYKAYWRIGWANKFANGFDARPAEPILYLVRRGDIGEISFWAKNIHPYTQNSPKDARWLKQSPWAYTFDLKDFVATTKHTIFEFLDTVQQNYINEESKAYAYKLSIMALSLNHYPELD
jgi:hypothetical protein